MTSQIVWSAYLVLAFAAMPLAFRVRYGWWPFAYRLPPKCAYTWIDLAYGLVVAAFTACVLIEPKTGRLAWAGLALAVASFLLITWAVMSMGASWRLGQGEKASESTDDAAVPEFVTRGPFRAVRHPIYIGLIGLSAGMALMRGMDWCAFGFLVITAAYALRQGRAETQYWQHGTNRPASHISC